MKIVLMEVIFYKLKKMLINFIPNSIKKKKNKKENNNNNKIGVNNSGIY